MVDRTQAGGNQAFRSVNGSDFDPAYFSPEENRKWSKLLNRMRAFEQAVCGQFRQIDAKFGQITNQLRIQDTVDRVRELDSSIKELENIRESDTFQMHEKLFEVDGEVEKMNLRIASFERLSRVQFGKIIERMKSEVSKITENLDALQGRVILLEFEQEESSPQWMEDGHSQEHEQLPGEQNNAVNTDGGEECRIMVSDPFLGGISPLEGYDGNPTISFARWVAKLEDMLSLYPQLTEPQKLSRLRILLKGQARAEFDAMDTPPTDLSEALNHLKRKFENENTRSIARQTMASCRQAPGERVYEFANRLNDVVRTALSGESEVTIRKRLFEEFLEKLTPDLQFEVKAGRPINYSNAYEIAQHFELLLATKRSSQVSVADSVAELSNQVEALAIRQHQAPHQKGVDRRTCFYCRRIGHIVKDCRDKKREEAQKCLREQRGSGYYGNGRQWNREGNVRTNHRFTPRERGHRNERFNRRSPAPYDEERGDNFGNNRMQSPGRRVRFGGGRIGAARMASPIFLAIIVVLAMFGVNSAINPMASPMICHPDAPSSLWTIPADAICPDWSPTEVPVAMKLSIFRPNTLQYKTIATACKCVKTTISRRLGFFGGGSEEISTSPIEVPTANCARMKVTNESPGGKLIKGNGTFKATNNSLEVGWRGWPMGIFWKTTTVTNCFVYETVVFTRHGMTGLSTPINDCPLCTYQAGSCRCPQLSLIWKPDQTQQCRFVKVADWSGEYSTSIWTAESGDFALTFANISEKRDCGGQEFIVSDQGFAVQRRDYEEMIGRSEEANPKPRRKREYEFAFDNGNYYPPEGRESENKQKDDSVGLVYSSQLAAQLTALSVKVTSNTRKMFAETVRKICAGLRFLADQTLSLAEANPTLLARFYLANPFLMARMVTKDMLEVRPCFAVNEQNMHFHWQNGHCFDKLPVLFYLYGRHEIQKHGFLDPQTLIIHAHARETSCKEFRFIYITSKGSVKQYDQISGDIKEIPPESMHYLSRHVKIDFPEVPIQYFRNKMMANLSELYSPEHFQETLEVAKIAQEIVRLSKPDAWEASSEKTDQMAANIVSNGLFSFLRGGLISANQLWVFFCCLYVTITVIVQIILPAPLAQAMQYLGIGRPILNGLKAARDYAIKRGEVTQPKNRLETDTRKRQPEKERSSPIENFPKSIIKVKNDLQTTAPSTSQIKKVAISIPLTERWLSVDSALANPNTKKNEQSPKVANIATISTSTCDENYRINAEINGSRTNVLLDSGAHVSLCSKLTAVKLGIKQLNASDIIGVIGISDKMVPILGKCEITLGLAGCKVHTSVYVVETKVGGIGSYEIIIGRNSFRQLPLFLDLQSGILIRKESGKLVANKPEETFVEIKTVKSGINEDLDRCLERNFDVFSKHDYDLGDCTLKAPPILTTSTAPERVRPYPVPEKYEKELKMHIEKMLEAGVIKESCTPWAHNIVLVKKSNGQLRPCVDFRPLNKVTIPDPYPIPRMDKTILRVAGRKFYSTLDLASGFWQIPLDQNSSHKCGIVTPWGLYQMVKLPFGLRNAPSIFQRTMDKTLEGVKNVTVYIDDILIHTDTIKDHIETLEEVFNRLRKNKLKLKISKCAFLKSECTYLGHVLNEKGYRPSLSNQEVIEAFPEPRNAKEVKRFLGMMSFFRKFIPNFATVANPLQQLTKEQNPNFEWGVPEKKAFDELKAKLLTAPCLRAPSYELPFYLFTDASAIAYAGALMQTVNGHDLHAVGYWSRTLSSTESKLPPTHGELAAIVHAVQNFRPIIYGAELTILTDHRPLTFLFSKSSTNPKLNRWLMALGEFEPQVIYVEGKANKVADALSRVPIKWEQVEAKSKDEIPFLLVAEEENAINKEKIEKESAEDPILSQVIAKMKESWIEPISAELEPYFRKRDKLFLDGKIIRKKPGRQIVIPGKMRNSILKLIHRSHFGVVRNKSRARNLVWWPKLPEEVENFVKECEICQRNAPNRPRTDPDYKWPEAKYSFERVHADLAGPIWGTNFLIVVDAHSKYPFVCQMQSTHSLAIINYLREIFGMFGSPKSMVTDNGPQFISSEMERFLEGEGVRHLRTPTYHPASNGEAERFVRTFKEGMCKLLEEGMSLKVAQFLLLQEYRATPCFATGGESPSQKFLGREIRTALDKIRMPPNVVINEHQTSGEVTQTEDPMGQRNGGTNFSPGDTIWYREPNGKWSPGVLLQPVGERLWELEMEGSTTARTAHLDQIKGRRVGPSRHL